MGLISFIRINPVTDKNDVRTAILRTRVWHATVRMADVGNDCSVDRSFEFCVYVFPFFIFGNFLSKFSNSAHADNTQILILQLYQRIQCIRHFQNPRVSSMYLFVLTYLILMQMMIYHFRL